MGARGHTHGVYASGGGGGEKQRGAHARHSATLPASAPTHSVDGFAPCCPFTPPPVGAVGRMTRCR